MLPALQFVLCQTESVSSLTALTALTALAALAALATLTTLTGVVAGGVARRGSAHVLHGEVNHRRSNGNGHEFFLAHRFFFKRV